MKELIRDLANKDQHNLKLRFQVGLGIILFCFCLFTTTIIYHFQKNLLEEESLRQTELIMTTLESTRDYIREVLRPRMYAEFGGDRFILEAMSTSYITRVIMERFKEKVPAFKYRRVALDAMNPGFEADRQEREMIEYFRSHPDIQEWSGMTWMESNRYYTLYRPVVFNSSCLHCHGNPDDAPSAIRESYGAEKGFHRREDDITGVFSISIPMEVGLAEIRETSIRTFGMVMLLALLLYGTIWLLFHQLIISNLRDLVALFRSIIEEDETIPAPEYLKGHKEELEGLFRSARTLVVRLQDSRSKLLEYADNLEVMVAERTEALKLSENQLRTQVKKRNRELMLLNTLTDLINRTETLQSILPRILHEALQVIPANGAGIYLYNEKREDFVLQCAEQAPMLPAQMDFEHEGTGVNELFASQQPIGCQQIRVNSSETTNTIYIRVPLCCRNRLHGILVITELPCKALNDALQELLLSIGQQIGITIESLQNIQNLRRSTELLQSVFNGISDPLILLDPDGTLQMVNQAFLLRHNLKMDEALGMSVDRIPSKRQCLFSACVQDVYLREKEPHTEEIELDDGAIFDVYFYPILNAENSIRAIVCFAKDVTVNKKTERRIQQTEKLVAVGQLAAGVAHEINNPLGVILCYTDIIKENNNHDEELITDIRVIERHTENCRRIVADLLDFSRSRESKIDKQPQSVNDTIEKVLSMVSQQFLKKRIDIIRNLDPEIPPCLMDGQRMKQVLLNLVMNAGQAVESSGSITVSSGLRNGKIILSVEDDGPGIPKDIQDKIFDPFFSTKDPGQGTGLGLSVSYGIVREHDGEIRVQSVPGNGARFSVILPAMQGSQINE